MHDKFVNIYDYQRVSKNFLTKMAYDYINGGSLDELTFARNTRAFEKILLKQFVLVDVSEIDTTTSILGESYANPLIIGAVSLHKLSHPDGELATARAAENLDSLMLLSSLASTSLEDVAKASNARKWFQLYWFKDRTITKDIVERVEQAGYSAIALTVDAPVLGAREKDAYNEFTLPRHVNMEHFTSMEQMKFPANERSNSGLAQYVVEQFDNTITWSDLDWLQSITKLPILLKGVQTKEDAKQSLDYGIDGVIVSNHGGRQLDTSLASIECLPRVVEAVEGKIDVLLDSGVRRGGDIIKAMAMGAKGVLIGRPYIWGLGARGQQGIEEVYNIIMKEMRDTMAMIGCPSVSQLDQSFLEEATIPTYS